MSCDRQVNTVPDRTGDLKYPKFSEGDQPS
jgi:hypothetical protein